VQKNYLVFHTFSGGMELLQPRGKLQIREISGSYKSVIKIGFWPWFWIHPILFHHRQPLNQIFCMEVISFWASEMLNGRWPGGYALQGVPWIQTHQTCWSYIPLDVTSAYSFVPVLSSLLELLGINTILTFFLIQAL